MTAENVKDLFEKKKIAPSLTVTVDATKQELRLVKPFFSMISSVPSSLPPAAQFVLSNLMNCFAKSRHVKEGLIGDIIFGFEASDIPAEATLQGLSELCKAGFIRFQAKDGAYVDFGSDHITSAFVRYEKPLLDLVFEGRDGEK